MGNFEKLSVLVIGVIIVMILVVAIYTWTANPDAIDDGGLAATTHAGGAPEEPFFVQPEPVPVKARPSADRAPAPEAPLPPAPALSDAPPPTPPRDAAAPVAQEIVHEVGSGDTLGGIAHRYLGKASLWPQIAELNNVRPETLRLGSKLRIPKAKGPPGTPASEASGAASSATTAKAGGSYTVRKGDTLQTIAVKTYGAHEMWPDIWLANLARLDDPNDVREGMVLQLP